MGVRVTSESYFSVGRALLAAIAIAASIAAVPAPSRADFIEPFDAANHPFWTVDEVRIGGYKQAIDNAPHEGGPALNLEVLGGRFPGGYENSILNFFLTPRPQIGTTIAFGKTDELYWGVAWDVKLIDRTLFEASFGGAVHDGPLDTFREASYGCEVNFKESASLGFALTQDWRLMATIDHMSNANLCVTNRGLTNAGLRLGYKF
jgi:cob(I)alamin adenosyltransferase